ncbi:MAG: hypothetical protein ABW019_08440, partial [Chitinophagaceae bacterium]
LTPGIKQTTMWHFFVKVIYQNGRSAGDVGVMIDYGWFGGTDEKRTGSDGWVRFKNHEGKSGDIWVAGRNMGSYSLSEGKRYSFTI